MNLNKDNKVIMKTNQIITNYNSSNKSTHGAQTPPTPSHFHPVVTEYTR